MPTQPIGKSGPDARFATSSIASVVLQP